MYASKIMALVYISESEISEIYPQYDSKWELEKPATLKNILYQFGLDTSKPYERQDGLTHRNMMNKIVTCSRWVGNSRLDVEWVQSGMASKECLDKVKNNRLLDDVYRSKYLTEDAQAALEARDKYTTITEEE
jgi:hypothetical protein